MRLKNTTDVKEEQLKLPLLQNTVVKLHAVFYLHGFLIELTIWTTNKFCFSSCSCHLQKGKACVNAFINFQWKFKQITFTQSLLTPDMVTINKLVAQPTSHGSFQINSLTTCYVTARKETLDRLPWTCTRLSGVLSYITCHEVHKRVRCFSYGVWRTVRQWATLNPPSKFFLPWGDFRAVLFLKTSFCKQVYWKDLS